MTDIRSPGRRTWVRRLLTAAVLVLVCLTGVSWLLGGRLTRPYPHRVGGPPMDLPVDSVDLHGAWGRIAGWRIGDHSDRGCVLLLHGIGADRRSMLSRARMLHRAGYGVLMIDQQGHGESEGDNVLFGARARWDAVTAVTALRGWGCARVGVIGVSMGGAATLLAGADLEADAVIVEQVYASLEEAADARFRRRVGPLATPLRMLLLAQLSPRFGLTAADVRPERAIAELEAPVLILAGEKDWRAPPEAAARLAAAAGGPADVWVVPGAGHESLHQRLGGTYEDRVLRFLARWLAPSS